jgi:hypothetical protein
MFSMLRNSPWMKMGSAAMSKAAAKSPMQAPQASMQAPMQAPQAPSAMPEQQMAKFNAMGSMMAGAPQGAGIGAAAGLGPAPMQQQSEANSFSQMMQKRRPQNGGMLSRSAFGSFRGF